MKSLFPFIIQRFKHFFLLGVFLYHMQFLLFLVIPC